MKKMISVLLIALCLGLPHFASAAGSCTATLSDSGLYHIKILTYACTGDAVNGAIPAKASPAVYGWVFMVTTIPGAVTAPTNNYSLYLSDADGVDISAGSLTSRSATAGQQYLTGRAVAGPLTLTASGQSVASATWTVKVWIYEQKF